MQLRPAYPVDTALGTCLVTGKYEIAPGVQIIDLDIDTETLPAWGRLCLHPDAVRLMCTLLGWKVVESVEDDRVPQLEAELRDAHTEIERLRAAIRQIIEIDRFVALDPAYEAIEVSG